MPVSAVVQSLSSKTYPFVITIGGRPAQDRIPLNGDGVRGLTYTLSGENGGGQASFTIEDPDSSFYLYFGAVVEIIDCRTSNDGVVLWGGTLVEAVLTERGSGLGRLITITAQSYDIWLDWKIVERWVSKADTPSSAGRAGQVQYLKNDNQIVSRLVMSNSGNGTIIAKEGGEFINQTNTNMPHMEFIGVSLRDALQQIAQAATSEADVPNRFFYVDENRKLHWYKDKENLVAPYYITDDIYTRRVLNTSGLVSLWRMTDASGTTCIDSKAYANGTYTGTVTLGVTSGVINEPYLKAARLNGSTGYVTATGTNLHPGDTFSIEIWFKRNVLSTAQALWSGGTNDVEIGFDASNKIVVNKEGVGANYTSTAAVTDALWHHLVVTRVPGTTTVYLDGSVLAGTVAAQTFVAAAGAVNIGRRLSATDRYFSGDVACAAVYSTAMSAVEAMRHATIGDGVNPIGIQVTLSAYDGRERVYIAGKNKAGSGWVTTRAWLTDATFGKSQYGSAEKVSFRDAFLDRPDSDTSAKQIAIGKAWLRRNDDPRQTATFTTVGYDGWKPGQLIYIHNTNLGCIVRDNNDKSPTYGLQVDDGRGVAFEITDVTVDVSLGNGVLVYNITCGPRFLRGSRILTRMQKDTSN